MFFRVYVFDKQVPPHLCSVGKENSSLTIWRLIVTSIWWAFTSQVISLKRKARHPLLGSPSSTYNKGMPVSHYTASSIQFNLTFALG